MGKIENLRRNFVNWYYSIDVVKRLAFTITAVVILFLIVNLIGKIKVSGRLIDYSTLNPEYITESLEITKDRTIYLNSTDCISKMILSSIGQYKIGNKKVGLSHYYKYVKFDEYSISKGKFKKAINTISDEIFEGKSRENVDVSSIYPIVKNVYVMSEANQLYICELNTEQQHFIGIKFQNDLFYIFYIV